VSFSEVHLRGEASLVWFDTLKYITVAQNRYTGADSCLYVLRCAYDLDGFMVDCRLLPSDSGASYMVLPRLPGRLLAT
jgi:hypothetical protein